MKEIKIMVRADFAGDVALWIFIIVYIYIYIPFCIYIYICIYFLSNQPWAPSRLLGSRFHERATVGSAFCIFGSSVTSAGVSFSRIFPVVRRTRASVFFFFLFPRPRFNRFCLIFVFARLAASLATKTDDPIARDLLSRCLSRSSSASSASTLCSRAGSLRRDSRTLSMRVRVPPFPLLHRRRGPENLTRADAIAPPAPLRVTGICKSIYL